MSAARLNETMDLDETRAAVSPHARALVDGSLVWDMTLPWTPDYVYERILPRFHRAGVDVISLTVMGPERDLPGTFAHVAKVSSHIDVTPGMRRCGTVAEIRAARSAGELALVYNFQETKHFDTGLETIAAWHALGVRHALLAYNSRNRVGDGCSERTDAGLSRWGVAVVEEMIRVGMLVDGTHTGHATTMDAINVCRDHGAPFIFSHCCAHAVVPHYRNIHDDQIRACAETGGVIGVRAERVPRRSGTVLAVHIRPSRLHGRAGRGASSRPGPGLRARRGRVLGLGGGLPAYVA